MAGAETSSGALLRGARSLMTVLCHARCLLTQFRPLLPLPVSFSSLVFSLFFFTPFFFLCFSARLFYSASLAIYQFFFSIAFTRPFLCLTLLFFFLIQKQFSVSRSIS